MTIQQIKQRFGIIGNSEGLNRAIDIASQVAPTDLSVLITGESGSGKEAMPQIIHQLSARKHNQYIAVNCGAIPEGTIDSELFGHEKGSFTGAHDSRKGYFEVADGGTIFLDEVAELPTQTQARLLRVLESGEFLKVGSSKVLKTNVRIVAATNVNIPEAIRNNKFREDLYYRLNTVPIEVPPLRNRKGDIHLIFRKFASDFAEKYKMPSIHLTPDAVKLLEKYRWPGNVRQLKNVTEQISVIEQEKEITAHTLLKYLPENSEKSLPILYTGDQEGMSERDILYKVLFEMKKDVTDLKKIVFQVINSDSAVGKHEENEQVIERLYGEPKSPSKVNFDKLQITESIDNHEQKAYETANDIADDMEEYQEVESEESLSISETEKRLIKKALEKHHGKRKNASEDLGISERTLYRKIKEYEIEQ
ncbi:MAG: sigma-54-dependent Fis family transcriptional regulator [Bacteroidetes bacterium]|nr:MAG: sigma-54-dependent Fis family transcriptional regulator [Bacteroidota bacterium]MBL1145717.1 sigma-54-dependent Fis family transcriptional regulator [Bacteroidota bacterium]NOG58511.1 sigma-54-dependent Fis family transcriptional regulator [Bacteroidota bacterium]